MQNPLANLHIKGDFLVEGSFRIPFNNPAEITSNSLVYIDYLGNMRSTKYVSINADDRRVGIGIVLPQYELDVVGTIHNTSNLIVDGRANITELVTASSNVNINSNLKVFGTSAFVGEVVTNSGIVIGASNIRNDSSTNYRLQINNNNDIGMAYDMFSCNLYVKNDIVATAFTQLSDFNVKTNITDLDYNNDLMNLRPVSFNWSSNYYNKEKIGDGDVGLIAQEVETIIPNLVFDNVMLDGNKWKTVNYTGLIPYMIKHIQDLNKRIEVLENKLNNI
jgi:hypothetical protein